MLAEGIKKGGSWADAAGRPWGMRAALLHVLVAVCLLAVRKQA